MAGPHAFLVLAIAAAQAGSPVIRHAEPLAGDAAPTALTSAEDVARLCRALVPAERVRAGGDAIARGAEEARHAAAREEALLRRYRVVVPGRGLRFEAYDAAGGELVLDDRAPLPAAKGAARVWLAEEAGLPVEVAPGSAKRILEAQARGTLALALDFDLPEDATCGGGAARTFALAAEPVAWRWLDGDAPLAGGGEAAGRGLGLVNPQPRVEIGAPLQGPPEARAAVASRTADLERCYADALARNPGIDGVLVARLGGAGGLAADSVGDPGLADCVHRAVGRVAGSGAVPIRFELAEARTGGQAPR
jgi:hypothetical protein